jgi:hypothetical protein
VPSSCPICEQPISPTATHCTVCGFPTALAIEGLRSVDTALPPTPGDPDEPASAGPRAPRPTSPTSDLSSRISRDLLAKMDLVREMGRSLPDATSELCQAALGEAEGREGEALDTLRNAQVRMEREVDDLVESRTRSVAERQRALTAHGVHFAFGDALARVPDILSQGRREQAVEMLLDSEKRVGQFEADWKGLQGLLGQIETLRSEAAELGIPLGEIAAELDGIRQRLEGSELDEEALDEIAQASAQSLMLLHDSIPTALEQELARHAITLDRYPDDHVPSAVARRVHTEAARHLKKGRLSESVQSVRELRRQIESMEAAPEGPEERGEAGSTATPAVPESEAEMLDRLLRKARSLAARVRTLPPESETAHEAAAEIRSATELLRTREFEAADQTLARLMRMLAAETPGA